MSIFNTKPNPKYRLKLSKTFILHFFAMVMVMMFEIGTIWTEIELFSSEIIGPVVSMLVVDSYIAPPHGYYACYAE